VPRRRQRRRGADGHDRAALVALILMFGPMSARHFHPTVTLADASQGGLLWRNVPSYVAVQDMGEFAGVLDPSRVTGNQEERLQIFRRVRDEIAVGIRAWQAERVV
jgi:hypothetical protein